jgi:hypothetical protein
VVTLGVMPVSAQRMMLGTSTGGKLHIMGSDLAVLEAHEPRQDLTCTVTMGKPVLGFDLKYHVSYEVTMPLTELEGDENMLSILFRVEQKNQANPVFFSHRIRVPKIEDITKGDAYFSGSFDIGEGDYAIGWLMRDRAERVCANFFDVDAHLADKDREIKLDLPPGKIAATEMEQFLPEPPVARVPDSLLNVKVLVNFAPQKSRASSLQPLDTQALVSILRGIARDPRVGKFSVVAFNMQDQKVIYRAQNTDHIDFPAIGKALDNIKLGTVDLSRLSDKDSDIKFLGGLLREELTSVDEAVDAVIFAGPKVMLESNVPADALRDVGQVNCPVFYMNYNLHPTEIPWRDSIGNAVKFWRGVEFTISKPRDLWNAVSDMFGRVVKSRRSKTAGSTIPTTSFQH